MHNLVLVHIPVVDFTAVAMILQTEPTTATPVQHKQMVVITTPL